MGVQTHDSNCPICKWRGGLWEKVECKPGAYVRKKCPTCGSYPRDRLTWLLLQELAQNVRPKTLRVIEIGGSCSSYDWKRKLYFYRNADLPDCSSQTVDLCVVGGSVLGAPKDFDVAIISYVLSMVEDQAIRISLLKELHELTHEKGGLILFDDLLLDHPQHAKVEHDGIFISFD